MARNDIAGGAVAVTPNDGTPLFPNGSCFGLYVGVAGNVTVIMEDGETVAFTAVPAGTFMPIKATYVKATGTTATNIVALKQ